MSKDFKNFTEDFSKELESTVKLIEAYKVNTLNLLHEIDRGLTVKVSNKRARKLTLDLEKQGKKIREKLLNIKNDGKTYRQLSVKYQDEM